MELTHGTHGTDGTHTYRRAMFTEKLTMHGDNRRFAAALEIEPALIADGTSGVVIRHGKRVMVFTRDEARTLVEGITEVIEP